MLGATALYAGYVIKEAGGLSAITDGVQELFSSPASLISGDQVLAMTPDQASGVTGPLLAVFALQWLIQLNSDGTGFLAQRTMACRSDRDAKMASVVFTFTQILLRSLLWLPIALGLLVIFPPQNMQSEMFQALREATFVRGMDELLPPGVKGIMLTGMLAALASTVDTHLNWGSSYWTNDIYKRIVCEIWLKKEPSQKSLVWVARGANLLVLIIAMMIGTQLTSINAAWQISLLLGAGVGIVLIMRWVWWRMTSWGEISAIAASMILSPIVFFGIEDQAFRLLLVAGGSTLVSLLVVLIGGPEKEEGLINFYRKVRPPGFWGKIADKVQPGLAASARKELWQKLTTMVICGVSLFSLLVGFGSWLIGSPPPQWVPSSALWIGFCLLVGVVLIPVWWKMGFKDSEG